MEQSRTCVYLRDVKLPGNELFTSSFLLKERPGSATRGQSFELVICRFHLSKAHTLCSADLSKLVAFFPCHCSRLPVQ